MNQGGVSAIADLSLPGNSLTSVTAWRYWHWYPHNDGDSTSLDAGRDFHQSNEQQQFSQELRIASEGERRIDYVAGVYYLWQEIKANAVNAYGTRAADRFLAPTVDRVVGAAALNNYSYVSDSNPITNSYAAFTQGIWHITPMLDLTGGLRYTYEEKRGYFNQTASGADLSTLTTAQQAAAQAIRAPYGIANSYTAPGRVSGQAMLTYKVTPDASPAQDTAVQKWKLHLPIAYDNASPAPPSPDVGHHIEDDRLNLAVAEVAFENARSAAEFFARSAFHTMLGQQSRYLDAIGAYLVTGFYTFVRDGVPTTAGLRGSRAAELINMVGAANQTAPDIVARFAPIHEGRG